MDHLEMSKYSVIEDPEADIFQQCLDATGYFRDHPNAMVIPAMLAPKCGLGLDRQVYQKAGAEKMLAARQECGELEPGQCCITPSFGLFKNGYVIHAGTPYFHQNNSFVDLINCYKNAMECAREKKCRTVVFSLLGSGVMKFPYLIAKQIADTVLGRYQLDPDFDNIVLVCRSHPKEELKEAKIISQYERNERLERLAKLYDQLESEEKRAEQFRKQLEESFLLTGIMTKKPVADAQKFKAYFDMLLKTRNAQEIHIQYSGNTVKDIVIGTTNKNPPRSLTKFCERHSFVDQQKRRKSSCFFSINTISKFQTGKTRQIPHDKLLFMGLMFGLNIEEFAKLMGYGGYVFPYDEFDKQFAKQIEKANYREAVLLLAQNVLNKENESKKENKPKKQTKKKETSQG